MGPIALAVDSRGRLFVADRSNNRIQIFDKDMNYLDSWKHFGRPSGITILKDDTIIVADSESGIRLAGPAASFEGGPGPQFRNVGWKQGIRIGSARDGSVTAFIEDMESTRAEHSGAEGVGVDARGNVYGAVVRRQMLERHIRK